MSSPTLSGYRPVRSSCYCPFQACPVTGLSHPVRLPSCPAFLLLSFPGMSCYRPVPPCPVTVLSGLHVTVLSRHALLPACPFLTVLFLPVRSCLVNVQAGLAQCLYLPVQPRYRPIPLFTSYFPVSHCPVPPSPDSLVVPLCPITFLLH
jgi:hypothetical protein